MQASILDQEKFKKDRKTILKEENTKKEEKRKKKSVDVRKIKEKEILREVMVKIRLERIDMQEKIIVEVLLDSGTIRLVISSEFAQRQEFKLKKMERSIYIKNVNGAFNKEEPIKNTVKVNIYY